MSKIVGRKREQEILRRLANSGEAEFLALYGRRRIGKTYLVNEFFSHDEIFFEVTGSPNASTPEQLLNFHTEYCALFESEALITPPKNWSEALHRLAAKCRQLPEAKRIILFFDELPWLATAKSGFLSALSYFWNRHASRLSNVILIVCGSAASWMISKIVNDKGGLYGRLSAKIRLLPFTLSETEHYLQSRGIDLPRKQICELYMVCGGIAKYLSYVPRGLSATQMIDQLCFSAQAPLLTEFHKLYASLFKHPERHVEIIELLATAGQGGLTRQGLLNKSKELSAGGRASTVLRELEESGFISTFACFGKKNNENMYRLTDEYSLFYLRWINPVKSSLLQSPEMGYWLQIQGTPSWFAWAGRAFESLCLKHIPGIKRALAIGGVITQESRWRHQAPRGGQEEGAEIDLVIDRADNCINLCEIKFSDDEYVVTKKYAEDLERKKRVFRRVTQTHKALITTLITPYGVKQGDHALRVVDNFITLDAIF